MRASHRILIATSLALCGGPALAASPVGVADPARIAAAAQTCARHIGVSDIDTAAIRAEGWKPLDAAAWPNRTFPAQARLFSRGDGVVLETVADPASNYTGCIVFARRAPQQSLDDVEQGLTAAFGDAPVHKDTADSRPKTLWAMNRILFLLTPDKIESDVIDVTIAPQKADAPVKAKPVGQG